MKQTITKFLLVLSLLLVPITASPVLTYAACGTGDDTAKGRVLEGIGGTSSDCTGTGVSTLASTVVSILSVVIGIAAVIMIIIAGLKYTTSGGDSGKISSAKSTLTYALVGLVVAALAQFLVHFVLNSASSTVTPCPTNKSITAGSPACKP